jgi:hypothetical protein
MKVFAGAAILSTAMAATPFPTDKGGEWQFVSVAGSKCLNGAETGVWLRNSKSGNKNFAVYFNGGGACWNAITCGTAAASPKGGAPRNDGVFALRSDNPLNDYNWIAIPYCTGDVHAGDTVGTSGATKGKNFAGSANLKLFLERAAATYKAVETLFVTGESAGGFGSVATYATTRSFFPNARGVLMDDSGPIIADDDLPVCLQKTWRDTWDLNKNLPKDCACNNPDGDLVDAWTYGQKTWPKDSFSLVSSVNDATISFFFSFGLNNCHPIVPLGYNKIHAGLEDLAKRGVPVYMIPGSSHTHTSSNEFYSRTVAGQALYKWIAQLMDPNQPDPATLRPTAEDYYNEENGLKPNTTSIVV